MASFATLITAVNSTNPVCVAGECVRLCRFRRPLRGCIQHLTADSDAAVHGALGPHALARTVHERATGRANRRHPATGLLMFGGCLNLPCYAPRSFAGTSCSGDCVMAVP